MYQLHTERKFRKSFKKLLSNKKFNKKVFEDVVSNLRNREVLEARFKDHAIDWFAKRLKGMPPVSRSTIDV